MKSTIIFLFFLTNFIYRQTGAAVEKISGIYQAGSKESMRFTLILNDNKTFKSLTESNLLGNSNNKGKWKTSADTLFLFSKKELWDKYLIKGDSLIEIRIARTEDGLWNLKRQK